MKWKKLLADDGVEIVVYTMLAWAFLFVMFVLNSHFQAVVMAKHPPSWPSGLARLAIRQHRSERA